MRFSLIIRRCLDSVLLVSVLLTSFIGSAASSDSIEKEWIVKFKTQAGFVSHESYLTSQYPVEIMDSHQAGKLSLIKTFVGMVDQNIIVRLLQDPNVEYVVENIDFHAFDMPDDPLFEQQWALKIVNAAEQWDIKASSEDVVVAVIDTGVDYSHEDLSGNIWTNPNESNNGIDDDGNGFVDDVRGWDFRENNNNPMDETSSKNPGHGTHCAGIIGAMGNNGVGVSGITQKVKIMPIRFLGADGSGNLLSAAKAIDYATENGADVISASWGANVQRNQVTPILEAIERAGEKDIIFVAAAANDGRSNDQVEMYPANAGFPHVISVAASNPSDQKPQWSNYGLASVDLASPGEGILSTLPGNKYKKLSGTSMATPLVAGEVSLLISQAREKGLKIKPTEVKSILQASGKKVEIETACNCRIDGAAAMTRLTEETPTVVPFNGTFGIGEETPVGAFGLEGKLAYIVDDPAIASIDENGILKGVAKGKVLVTVKDEQGTTATSGDLFIGKPDKKAGQCPFNNPLICVIMCQIEKQLPWCES